MSKQYDSSRPTISAETKRTVKVDAGHECSVKNCSEHTYLEIHHINQNREDNRIENLILLCGKHHKMAHANQIDRKSLKEYKDILNTQKLNNDVEVDNTLKTIKIKLDMQYNLVENHDKLVSIVQDIMFEAKSYKNLNIEFLILEHEENVKKLMLLKENNNLTQNDKEVRNTLQVLNDSKNERLKYISKSANILFYGASINYHYSQFGTNEAIKALKGLLDSYKNYQNRTKIDIWKEKPLHLSTYIRLTDEEMMEVESHPEIKTQQTLAFSGFYTYDLPNKIIIQKVLPAIAKEILRVMNGKSIKEEELLKEFSPLTWKIGLG